MRWPVSNADQVRAYIAATDARCPRCRYQLRGLRDPRCPECGHELTVQTLSRRRNIARAASIGEPISGLAWAIALNVGFALAVLASAVLNNGELPVLSWLAPGIVGAFLVSVQYCAVFFRCEAGRSDCMERMGPNVLWIVLAIQAGGLALMWV